MREDLDQIEARFSPLMPEGFRLQCGRPFGWKDDEGHWHEPKPDSYILRVSSALHVCDGEFSKADLDFSDDQFNTRILVPMVTLLRDHVEQGSRVREAFEREGLTPP